MSSNSDFQDILAFLESQYDIPRSRLVDMIDANEVPEDPRELLFVKEKLIYGNDDTVGDLTDEFIAQVQYLDDLLKLNFDNTPDTKNGYISQATVPDEEKHRVRRKPNLSIHAILDDETYQDLVSRVEERVHIIEKELSECDIHPRLRDQLFLLFALMRYSINERRAADIKNSYRPLRYITSHHTVSVGRHEHGYHKIGHKLEFMFDDTSTICDKIYQYYNGKLKNLVNTVERSLEETDD